MIVLSLSDIMSNLPREYNVTVVNCRSCKYEKSEKYGVHIISENYVIDNRAKINFNLARHLKSSRAIVSNVTGILIISFKWDNLTIPTDVFVFNIKKMQRDSIKNVEEHVEE